MTDLGMLAHALNELYRLSGSAKVHADTVRRTGVQVSQTGLRALTLVEDTPRISATEIASTLDVSQPTASRTLQQLETDGFVTRHASDTDGRVSHYVVSPKGRRALAKVHQYHVDRLRFALADLDEPRRQGLADAVSELVHHLTQSTHVTRRTA